MQPINRYRSADLLDPPACQQEGVSVRDTAFEEVVADSMETMLTQGDAASFMAQLKQKDKTLWEKIRDWFKDLAKKLRDVVDAYKGYTPDSPEGRMVAQMEDFIGVLQEAYSEALMDASENYRVNRGNKKTTLEGGVKMQARPSAKNPELLDPRTVTKDDVKQLLENVKKGVYAENSYIPIRISTPGIIQERLFAENLPMAMPVKKIMQAYMPDNGPMPGKNVRGHALTV